MTSFLIRSSCPLEKLRLIDLDISADDLIECLEHTTSSLIDIMVQNNGQHCVTEAVLTRLSSSHGEAPFLCPKLEVIEFRTCDYFSNGALADMVDSRWESATATETASSLDQPVRCARLKSITVKWQRFWGLKDGCRNIDDIRRLEILQGKGLYVDVRNNVAGV